MDADWDLQAVVRGCCSVVSSTSTTTTTSVVTTPAPTPGTYNQQKSTFYGENCMEFFPDLYQSRSDNSIEKLLNDLYNPFNLPNLHKLTPSPKSFQISPISVLGGLQDPLYHHHHHQQQDDHFQRKKQSLSLSRCTTTHAQGTTKFKKRKNQIKKVCQVPAEGSSSDLWSWRKYGQKPIKGSPYPRGYYRCSTSKGCSARKQVERNRSDPGMLIITYTGEHSHPVPTQRSSLAGGSRNKTTASSDDDSRNKPSPSSPSSPTASLSPATEKINENDTDDDTNFDFSGVVIDDDIFDELGELVGPADRDGFSDHHASSNSAPPFSWLTNNVATTTTPPPLPAGVDF